MTKNNLSQVNTPQAADDEIDLRELFVAIWQGKWIIAATTFLFALIAVLYTLSLPNVYKSEVLLAPVAEDVGFKIPGQLGSLAALAGVNLGAGGGDKTSLALEILKSREFIGKFVINNDLLIPLMAAKGWDRESNTLIIDNSIYNIKTQEWVRDVSPPFEAKPSKQEAYNEFLKLLSVVQSKDTGMIKISVQNYSPFLSMEWVEMLVNELNEEMRKRVINETELSLKYLQSEIEKTELTDARSMLFSLIEEQTKSLMLANIRKEYTFKTVDPAFYPEIRHSPNRIIIIMMSIIVSLLAASVVIIINRFKIKLKI